MRIRLFYSTVLLTALLAAPAGAQQYTYPAKGQSANQQRIDEGDCYVWARDRTGIDPASGPVPVAVQQQPSGEILRGAARGALGGAIVGEISGGDAGRGAATGAVFGGVRSGVRQHKGQQQAAQNAQASAQQQFQRAYGACLEGRGYSVR